MSLYMSLYMDIFRCIFNTEKISFSKLKIEKKFFKLSSSVIKVLYIPLLSFKTKKIFSLFFKKNFFLKAKNFFSIKLYWILAFKFDFWY